MPSYESLVRDHHALVYRIALGVLRDRAAAEDVAQDVFLEFLRHPEAIDRAENARAFVGRAAVNRALNSRRGEARRVKHEQAALTREATMDPIEEVFRREVRAKVAELPEEERLAVDLHYFQGFTLAETAGALDVGHSTVSARLTGAFAKLRKALGAAAFVALLAGLESELSRCSAEEIPSTLPDRLLRLRNRPAPLARSAGRRFAALTVSLGIALLLAIFGAKKFQAWRDGREVGSAAGADARPAGPVVADAVSAGSSRPADLAIDRDRDLHGVVVTEAGSPVEGALLSTVTHPWRRANLLAPESSNEEVLGAGTRSGADGSFVIRLHRGDVVALRVAAEGFARYEIPKCQAGEKLRIVVRPGVRLVARALDEQGRVVAGARLWLSRSDSEPDVAFDAKGITGPDGTCVFADLPPACRAILTLRQDEVAGSAISPVRLPGSGELRIDVTMLRGRVMSGRVTDATTGKPIPGARVGTDLRMMIALMDPPVVADAEGRYRLPLWREEGARIGADADGYAPEFADAGDASVVDFALSPGDTVTGRILTASHLAVPGARVSVVAFESREGKGNYTHRNGISDDTGRFRVTGLIRGVPHTLVAMADGFGRLLLDFNPPSDAASIVDLGDIVLPEGRAVEGRVLDTAGNPVPRIVVTLNGFNADRDRLRPGAALLPNFYGCDESVASDDLGRFRFRDLAPGNYVAKVTEKGAPQVTVPVTISPERDVTGVELRVPGADGVRVLVLDERGVPIEGVTVSGQAQDTPGAMATTGPDGRALLRLAAPSVTVSVWLDDDGAHPCLSPKNQVATADSRDLTFVLAEAGTASGEVVTADGSPVAGARVEIVANGKGGSCVWADDAGRFTVLFPLPGPVDLVLLFRTSGEGVGASTLLEGRLESVIAGSKGLRLVARPVAFDRSLVVRLETPDGHPAAGVTVETRLHENELQSVVTDAGGIARFSALPAATVEIRASPEDHSDWLDVRASVIPEGQEYVAKIREGAWLEGIVVGPDGLPVAGAKVVAFVDGGENHAGDSGDDGRFRLLLDPDESRRVDLEGSWNGNGETPGPNEMSGTLEGVHPGGAPVTLRLEKE